MEEKKKGGRPKKEESEKLNYKLGLRFSKADMVIIKLRAEQAGISESEYIRQAALKGKINRKPTAEENQFYFDFTGVSNNLNQLTKLAHQENLGMIAPRLLSTLKELTRIAKGLNDN